MTSSFYKETFCGIVTVRPGRRLLVRTVRIGNDKNEATTAASHDDCCILQVVLVHGTCGTQAQYEFLLASLAKQMQQQMHTESTHRRRVVVLECLLYDGMGCGESPLLSSWSDYTKEETCADLQALLATEIDATLPLLLVGHSYGPNIILTSLDKAPLPNVVGYVFLGSAVRTPSLPHHDGGHDIFRLPLFVLKCLQSKLNESFVKAAVHAQNEEIRRLSSEECVHNDMFMAKAYHTQSRWTTPDQVTRAILDKTPCIVIHGEDDHIIPMVAAQELANLVNAPLHAVPVASHLVMMEQSDKVASIILSFIEDKCIR